MKDGQTIGQWLKWDFEVNGDLEIKDKNGLRIYWEDSSECWGKWEYDFLQGTEIHYESSNGRIIDNRPPEVIEHKGHKYQLIRQTMPKTKAKEIQRRVATIYAVSYLAQRPYRAVELAKVLGVNIRTTYRILSDLRASNWLVKENLTYSIQPNQIQKLNHEKQTNNRPMDSLGL